MTRKKLSNNASIKFSKDESGVCRNKKLGRQQQFQKKDKINGCYSAATRKRPGPGQTTASWLPLFRKEPSKHVICNAIDHNKAKLEPRHVMQITTDISPVQFEPLGSPNCEGPLITALPGAAAAGWLLMNPHWQTFSSPKNTVMSSHSAMWSQLRLPSASVVFA